MPVAPGSQHNQAKADVASEPERLRDHRPVRLEPRRCAAPPAADVSTPRSSKPSSAQPDRDDERQGHERPSSSQQRRASTTIQRLPQSPEHRRAPQPAATDAAAAKDPMRRDREVSSPQQWRGGRSSPATAQTTEERLMRSRREGQPRGREAASRREQQPDTADELRQPQQRETRSPGSAGNERQALSKQQGSARTDERQQRARREDSREPRSARQQQRTSPERLRSSSNDPAKDRGQPEDVRAQRLGRHKRHTSPEQLQSSRSAQRSSRLASAEPRLRPLLDSSPRRLPARIRTVAVGSAPVLLRTGAAPRLCGDHEQGTKEDLPPPPPLPTLLPPPPPSLSRPSYDPGVDEPLHRICAA